MSIDLIPAPVEAFAAANPVLVHNALLVGGVVLGAAVVTGVTRFGLRKIGIDL